MARRIRRRRDSFCCWCKRGPLLATTDRSKLAFTADHLMPRALGGGRIVPCCRQCNQLKGSLRPEEWFWFIDNHPRYWKTFANAQQVAMTVASERVRRVWAGEEALSLQPMGSHVAPLLAGGFNG